LGHPNNQIFGYLVFLGYPKNRIFGYSVIWVIRITEFGNSGHLKKTKETKFGNNHPKPLESLAKKWSLSFEGIIIFLEKISAKTSNPKLLQSIPGTCPILKQF
jgi:hypothetical protein